ncbi:hypothetical protein GCM10023093_09850 [Nemorincola caseinilytica]|uniref:Uncharacterized protein n=1 Tax=Nemorincola caseinilytica TaxID=2054315 RepID=A0ABP8NBJ2_9BACT
MKKLLLISVMAMATCAYGQMKVDTTRTSVTVRQTVASAVKTLSIYRAFVPGQGMRYLAVYQPTAAELGEEPDISRMKFTDEAVRIKAMLDAALAQKPLNFSRLSINLLPYIDLTARLVELYSTSKEWNDYLQKNAASLRKSVTLMDGSEVTEISYDIQVAAAVFEKSDMLKELQELFGPYGYTVTQGGFPDEHQQLVSTDKLMLLGKDPNLFVPAPNTFINLLKTKK